MNHIHISDADILNAMRDRTMYEIRRIEDLEGLKKWFWVEPIKRGLYGEIISVSSDLSGDVFALILLPDGTEIDAPANDLEIFETQEQIECHIRNVYKDNDPDRHIADFRDMNGLDMGGLK